MAINLVREQRLVFGAPAPPAHVGAVTGDEESEPIVERSPKRAAAIRDPACRLRRTRTGDRA